MILKNFQICACPPDMMLNIDNRKCNSQTTCNTGEIKCGEHDKCIKSYQRYNIILMRYCRIGNKFYYI